MPTVCSDPDPCSLQLYFREFSSSSHCLYVCYCFAATWVGGGYILGCAEVVYNPTKGLVWATAPPSFAINMIIGE